MVFFAILSIVLTLASVRSASPVVAIFSRWGRWIFASFLLASLAQMIGWPNRSPEVLLGLGFLSWFLLESLYHWLAIGALSRSRYPLFPRFIVNRGGGEWPSTARFITLRNQLRKLGFRQVQALVAPLDEDIALRASIWENEARTTRLQILFLPQRAGSVSFTAGASSVLKDGRRLVTDNFFLPFGGFYPEPWQMERRPWLRSVPGLLKRHAERVNAAGGEANAFEGDPLEEINLEQRQLERLNTELGFLHPMDEREEHGHITPEGRFRLWTEWWSLSYLGRPRSY